MSTSADPTTRLHANSKGRHEPERPQAPPASGRPLKERPTGTSVTRQADALNSKDRLDCRNFSEALSPGFPASLGECCASGIDAADWAPGVGLSELAPLLDLVMRDWRVPMPRRTRAAKLRSGVPPAGGGTRAGRPVRVVAAELGLADATVYRWKAKDLIDRGMKPATSTSERDELAAARRRIRELETELALVKQAAKLFEEGCAQSHLPGHRPGWPDKASRPSDAAASSAWRRPGSSGGGAGRPRHASSGSPG
jgi:transposase